MTKYAMSIRLNDLTRQQLDEMTERFDATQAAIVATAIDRMYQQEIKTMNSQTYYITEAMLGDEATEDDARRMAEILTERGYDVEYGNRLGQDEADIATKDWEEGLDIISREKYSA